MPLAVNFLDRFSSALTDEFCELWQVYTVIDHSGQNPQILALKVVRLEDQNKQIIEGYKNEIQLLKRLQYCPKVIKLHDL